MPQGKTPKLKLSAQPVICKKCEKEYRGEEMNQHTLETGHKDFYLKPVSMPKKAGRN